MPTITIDGRTAEVPAGTNLVEAGLRVGVQIPHYCYHPRLSVVGQCRMCLVKIEGMAKLQTACTTQVMKDGMVVKVDDPDVKSGQEAIMEFLLINHPLDCPICDQAGECGLQDYSFKHGQSFSRFRYEEKRTYPAKERIPLGPTVLLNMNRCIQCTRCVRFTQEISKTGEIGFFERGSHAEIGTFPGHPLDNHLAGNVVDACPVGALTSTEFRFAERVWYLDKKPSICTGCDAGCNITLEHRGGAIRRYKPRVNPEVNDYWMCDFGRTSFRRYEEQPRLSSPRMRSADEATGCSWQEALDATAARLRRNKNGTVAILGSGFLTCEEAFLLRRLADEIGTPHRGVFAERGPRWVIPNPQGGVIGEETAPNRRGAEAAGLVPLAGGETPEALVNGDAAASCDVLVVADSDFGAAARDPRVVERLRRAKYLVVFGWADTPLARVADVALPTCHHAERGGTFVNVQNRLQHFERAFPPRGEARPGVEAFAALLARFAPSYREISIADTFAELATSVPAFAGLEFPRIPASGVTLTADPSAGAESRPEPATGRGAGEGHPG